jgi:hypothetical protein
MVFPSKSRYNHNTVISYQHTAKGCKIGLTIRLPRRPRDASMKPSPLDPKPPEVTDDRKKAGSKVMMARNRGPTIFRSYKTLLSELDSSTKS